MPFILLSALLITTTLADDTIEEPELRSSDYKHWSFIPPKRPALPEVKDKSWPRNAIDHFILADMEAKGLQPMPQAGPRTLIRRVTFDLTGLPPTPEEVEAFVKEWNQDQPADGRPPAAYARLVDRLLSSPAYGERWAQHWLDVARFAETDGFEHDKIRPEAWKYRDWVISALNEDVPYDKFIQAQIAGDEIEGLDAVATGFLMAGPDMPDINSQVERRDAKLNEMTGVVGQAILGLTMGCARCHDHKYDPISQADFYRLRAVFANVVHPKKDKLFDTVVDEPDATPPTSYVMIRGEFEKPGPKIAPGFPRVVNRAGTTIDAPSKEAKSSQRRAALARWITQPDHPMTARVMVNRLWLHHFGTGLVKTPGDFGFMGDVPTHPALLDWLASEFVSTDQSPPTPVGGHSGAWSMKRMHRLMVTSATYMQASRADDDAWSDELHTLASSRWAANKKIDPSNRNYWRANRRRLEGEAIRDAMLLIAGKLNNARGGEGVFPPLPPEVTANLLKGQWEVSKNEEDHYRRSIYIFARRNLRFPLFEVFDKPDTNTVCPQRPRSTTATQSLTLLNSPFSLDMAQALVERMKRESDGKITESFRRAFEYCFGRQPTKDQTVRVWAVAQEHPDALVEICLALFNSSEFVYID